MPSTPPIDRASSNRVSRHGLVGRNNEVLDDSEMTRSNTFRIFAGEFLQSFGLLVFVPLVFAIVGLVTGGINKSLIENAGPLVFLGIVVGAGFWATHNASLRATNEARNSYPVRKGEAYRAFYQLLREGERHIRGNLKDAERRTEWDLNIQRNLTKYCISEELSVYLQNTGARERSDTRFECEHVPYAIGFLRELLDRDFTWGRPLIK